MAKSLPVMYCIPCDLPICYRCSEHRTHRWMDVKRAYQTKRQQCKKPFISSEVEYNLGFRQRGLFEVVCNAVMYMLNSLVAKHLHVCGIILNPHLK